MRNVLVLRASTCALAGSLTLAVPAAATAAVARPASQAAARAPAGVASPAVTGYSVTGVLMAVAATSATNAWAVGTKGAVSSPLILHWNGRKWSSVPTGAPAGTPLVNAVAANSAGNAWALAPGPITGGRSTTVILHWNSHAWKRVPYPAPAGTRLSSVSVTSPANAWAVGSTAADQMIALHWNGSAWKRVPLPKLPVPAREGTALNSVSATSASNAWAVGAFTFASGLPAGTGFALHWNGKSWSRAVSAPAAHGDPVAVAATSPGSAWLTGCTCQGSSDSVVTGLWNGHTWKTVPTPDVKPPSAGVAIAAAGHLAWTSGRYGVMSLPMLLRWTGSAWKLTSAPSSKDIIWGVAVTSAANAWAVGSSTTDHTTILHWNGNKWS